MYLKKEKRNPTYSISDNFSKKWNLKQGCYVNKRLNKCQEWSMHITRKKKRKMKVVTSNNLIND